MVKYLTALAMIFFNFLIIILMNILFFNRVVGDVHKGHHIDFSKLQHDFKKFLAVFDKYLQLQLQFFQNDDIFCTKSIHIYNSWYPFFKATVS